MFETVVVNEPSVFEPLKFYCTYNVCENPWCQHDKHPIWSTPGYDIQQYTPFREPHHQKQERYVYYRGPQNMSFCNSSVKRVLEEKNGNVFHVAGFEINSIHWSSSIGKSRMTPVSFVKTTESYAIRR